MPYEIDKRTIIVHRKGKPDESYECSSHDEAQMRVRFIEECLTWIGTPFIDCGAVKGPKGAVDCVMMMTRASIDSGLHEPFDPRPYNPRHMLHGNEELLLKYLTEKLGCVEVESPAVGDIVTFQFGRVFSHGAVLLNKDEVVHAHRGMDMCVISPRKEPLLMYMDYKNMGRIPRPTKFFNYASTWKPK